MRNPIVPAATRAVALALVALFVVAGGVAAISNGAHAAGSSAQAAVCPHAAGSSAAAHACSHDANASATAPRACAHAAQAGAPHACPHASKAGAPHECPHAASRARADEARAPQCDAATRTQCDENRAEKRSEAPATTGLEGLVKAGRVVITAVAEAAFKLALTLARAAVRAVLPG